MLTRSFEPEQREPSKRIAKTDGIDAVMKSLKSLQISGLMSVRIHLLDPSSSVAV